MMSASKILLLLVFADYTITIVQLWSYKITPIARYKSVPIYGRLIPDLGFVYTIDEPFHYHYNPLYFMSIESAKRAIDIEESAFRVDKCKLLLKSASNLRII